jgi:hypothetical protein
MQGVLETRLHATGIRAEMLDEVTGIGMDGHLRPLGLQRPGDLIQPSLGLQRFEVIAQRTGKACPAALAGAATEGKEGKGLPGPGHLPWRQATGQKQHKSSEPWQHAAHLSSPSLPTHHRRVILAAALMRQPTETRQNSRNKKAIAARALAYRSDASGFSDE